MIGRFIRFYGPGLFYRVGWPTADGVIPFKLFYMLLSVSDNLGDRERLEASQAVTLGTALAENGKDPKTRRARRQLTKRAYPEVDF